MISRLGPVLVAVLLATPLLGQPTAAADDPDAAGPSLPEPAPQTARDRAEDALARAQALFEERSPAAARRQLARGGRDATMVLTDLQRTRGDLASADRERADSMLARPTDGDADPEGNGYTVDEAAPWCGDTVCIHYVTTTQDRPVMTDENTNSVPDSVEQALTTAEHVNDTYVAAGYRRPDSDGPVGGDTDKVDVYLADIGDQGLYGYCTWDPQREVAPWNRAGYCVIDDDFSEDQFPTNTPAENQRVTLAHEYFHAVQFAYDAYEDPWFMEATATWAEDELYDAVNDNRQYLPYGQLGSPATPLDEWEYGGFTQYGNWIFFRYLTERWSGSQAGLPTIVRDMWRKLSARAGARDLYSTQAVQSVLHARGTSFTNVYGQFADANRRPARSYSEGRAYDAAAPARTWRLGSSHRSTGPSHRWLDHLTSATMRYRPDSGLRKRDWAIRFRVDPPALASEPVARVTVYRESGRVSSSTIRLHRRGDSTRTVGFSSRSVKHVELVLVNASRRMQDCFQYGGDFVYSCYGRPAYNSMRTDFSARIFRR